MENKTQRDWMDWVQTGASVYTVYKLHQITNPPIDLAKASADIAAAEREREEQDIHFDRRIATREIEELPDNVYGYFTLASWYHKIRDDRRPRYMTEMRPTLNLCEARLRWLLKQLNPILAGRLQRAMEATLALQLMKFFWLRHLQNEWVQKCQFKNLLRNLTIGAPLVVAMAAIYMAFGWFSPPDAVRQQAMFLILGLFALAVVMTALFHGNPPKPAHLEDLEAEHLGSVFTAPYVSEQFKTLVDGGAITQSEADRKTVDNIDAASAVFRQYASQYEDLNTQFTKEEEAYQKARSLRLKTERDDERWAAKLEAEEAMRRQYSGIVTI